MAQATTTPHKCNTKYHEPVARVEDESDNSEYLPSDFEPDKVNRNDRECEDEVTIDSSHNINSGAFLLTEEKEKGGSVSLAPTNEHLLSVHEAFAGDDVVEEVFGNVGIAHTSKHPEMPNIWLLPVKQLKRSHSLDCL